MDIEKIYKQLTEINNRYSNKSVKIWISGVTNAKTTYELDNNLFTEITHYIGHIRSNENNVIKIEAQTIPELRDMIDQYLTTNNL